MKKVQCYEKYPCWVIFISNFVQISIYIIGATIISYLGLFWLIVYLLYIVGLEIKLLRRSCAKCYYYGKYCAFGKGKLCSLLFKRNNSKKFIHDKITWKDIVPDFIVSLFPIITGIIFLIINFNWTILILVILLILLTFTGNWFVRSLLACKYCKQKEIGCPAEQLFNKKKK